MGWMCSGRERLQRLHLGDGDKEEKNSFGNSANSRAIPPVSPRLTSERSDIVFQQLRFLHNLLNGQCRQQRDAELGDHQDGGDSAELVVHRYVIDEEIGQPHHVLPPGEQNGKERAGQQRPLEGPLHDEKTQDEEHQHEGTHVDRSRCAGLITPVLSDLGV